MIVAKCLYIQWRASFHCSLECKQRNELTWIVMKHLLKFVTSSHTFVHCFLKFDNEVRAYQGLETFWGNIHFTRLQIDSRAVNTLETVCHCFVGQVKRKFKKVCFNFDTGTRGWTKQCTFPPKSSVKTWLKNRSFCTVTNSLVATTRQTSHTRWKVAVNLPISSLLHMLEQF